MDVAKTFLIVVVILSLLTLYFFGGVVVVVGTFSVFGLGPGIVAALLWVSLGITITIHT